MKNRVLTFLMVIGMVGLLVGCSKLTKATLGEDQFETDKTVEENVYKTDGGKDIIDFKIDVTNIKETTDTKLVSDVVENFIEEKRNYYDGDFKEICIENLPSMPTDEIVFEAELKSNIEYNQDGLISIVFEDSNYCGGPHGSTTYTAKNFDVDAQKEISINDVFKKGYDEKLTEIIDKEIQKLIKKYKNSDIFYPNYKEMISNSFKDDGFYFSKNGITFIFNEYAIAPFAAGPIFIEVPLKDLDDILIFRK